MTERSFERIDLQNAAIQIRLQLRLADIEAVGFQRLPREARVAVQANEHSGRRAEAALQTEIACVFSDDANALAEVVFQLRFEGGEVVSELAVEVDVEVRTQLAEAPRCLHGESIGAVDFRRIELEAIAVRVVFAIERHRHFRFGPSRFCGQAIDEVGQWQFRFEEVLPVGSRAEVHFGVLRKARDEVIAFRVALKLQCLLQPAEVRGGHGAEADEIRAIGGGLKLHFLSPHCHRLR